MDALRVREKNRTTTLETEDEQTTLFTKIIQSTQKITNKPLRVLHFTHTRQKAEEIKEIFKQQSYDLVLGLNYQPLSMLSQGKLSEILLFISVHSLICVYKFPNFKKYHADTQLKKIYKYQEIIPTSTQVIYVFCSNDYWYARGNMSKFRKSPKQTREWLGDTGGQRRYFYNDNCILKYYRFYNASYLIREVSGEIDFLTNHQFQGVLTPKIFDSHINTYEGWILREKIPGYPLSDLIDENAGYDPVLILNEVLKQVKIYEQELRFHTDLRPRNILITYAGQYLLIDYGAITSPKKKHALHGYCGFIVFAYEIFHRKNSSANRKLAPTYLIDNALHELYHRWLKLILSIPCEQWSFSFFQRCLSEAEHGDCGSAIDYEDFQRWVKKMLPLVENGKLRPRRFEKIAIKKLNGYFDNENILGKLGEFLLQKLIICYDTISLAVTSSRKTTPDR